jgi:hypothetical protein
VFAGDNEEEKDMSNNKDGYTGGQYFIAFILLVLTACCLVSVVNGGAGIIEKILP